MKDQREKMTTTSNNAILINNQLILLTITSMNIVKQKPRIYKQKVNKQVTKVTLLKSKSNQGYKIMFTTQEIKKQNNQFNLNISNKEELQLHLKEHKVVSIKLNHIVNLKIFRVSPRNQGCQVQQNLVEVSIRENLSKLPQWNLLVLPI